MKIYIINSKDGDCYDGYRSCPIIEYCNSKETAEHYIKSSFPDDIDNYEIEEKKVLALESVKKL